VALHVDLAAHRRSIPLTIFAVVFGEPRGLSYQLNALGWRRLDKFRVSKSRPVF